MAGKILKDYTPSEIKGLTDFSEANRSFVNNLHSQPQDDQDYARHSGGGGGSNPTPWYDAFRLDHGKDGARITQGWLEWYVTTIVFEKKFIYDVDGVLLEDVNSLASQEPIEGVKVLAMDQAAEYDEERWLELGWWGDVWAIVELSEETGEPLKLTIEPNDGNMRPIPRLDSDLSRGSSGSDDGTRCGYSVKIGTVPQNDTIQQSHIGNLYWFVAFIPEATTSSSSGSSGSSSSESSSSESSSSAGSSSVGSSSVSSGSGSSKDTAIVPHPNGGYCKWYAMEATEVLFFDFQEFELPKGKHSIEVDPVVVFGCEPNSLRAWTSPDVGTCHAVVSSDRIKLSVRTSRKKQQVQVMLKGVRRGFAKVRNAYATFEDFVDNECRLNPRMSRKQVIAELAKVGVIE